MSFPQDQEQRVKVVAGYALQQRLGSGSFATVYKGIRVKPQQQPQQPVFDDDENDSSSSSTQRQDKQEHKDNFNSQKQPPSTVAIKAIARTSEKLTKKVLQNLEIEISILRTYRHPNIVCMHDVQKTDRHFYLLLEYCGGGDVQHLIRSRQKGRLSERLTRRLMRDLANGLRFLWGQELIHRDIKPQNLLLTGPLPMEELAENPLIAGKSGDGGTSTSMSRSIHDDPNLGFSLKIADFGFARHLQTASLAETLCGSPLYMAPEILQHHRYDAKADLWSVGTVLFEMIAGRPPFNGENHIDLLRNIQRKAVRLPPDVRVSKACVNLLRLLLNRNPLSRAGFKEFFEACDAFVALGCGGIAAGKNEGGVGYNSGVGTVGSASNRIGTTAKDLGTIHENDHVANNTSSSDSLMTVATTPEQHQENDPGPQNSIQQRAEIVTTVMSTNATSTQQGQQQQPQSTNVVSPNLAPLATPSIASFIPNSINMYNNPNTVRPQSAYQAPNIRNRLAPLTSSPPQALRPVYFPPSNARIPPLLPSPTASGNNTQQHAMYQQQQQQQIQQQQSAVGYYASSGTGMVQVNSVSQSQASVSDDSGFVMVEHSKSPTSSQHYYATSSQQYRGSNSSNEIVEQRSRVSKGMLSTSPGTGKMLLGMVGRATIGFAVGGGNNDNASSPQPSSTINKQQIEQSSRIAKIADEIAAASKMIATAEDVGRRAVSVAHLGDSRAYLGMRLIFKTNGEGSSLLSSTPMEGVEEEPGANESTSVNSADDSNDISTDNSGSTEIMASTRRRSSSVSADKQMLAEECVEDEMPFAISPDAPSVSLPSRSNPSVYHRSTSFSVMKKSSSMSANPQNIRSRFGEALSCYVKSLKMLKGAVGAAQRVTKDLQDIEERIRQNNNYRGTDHDVPKLKQRCETTSNWLCSQFRGVLERADAANVEIAKLTGPNTNSTNASGTKEGNRTPSTVSVEELIYNHALASGRDGAVKQLLGQYEAARSSYRSAGLLAETLLMEVNIGADDRKILEGYVDGFAARITELDQLTLQQSRMAISSNTTPSQSQQSRRGSGIVGLIGPPSTASAASSPFVVGSSR